MSVTETLRADQHEAVAKALSLDGRMLISGELRSGKSRTALAIAEQLGVSRILLVGLDVYFEAWEYELEKLAAQGHPFYLPFIRLSTGARLDDRAVALDTLRKQQTPALVAWNYEAWWQKKPRLAIKRWQPELVIYDESHRLINKGTRSARFAHQIANDEPWAKHILGLTGTPQEGGYEDLFSLLKSINVNCFGNDWASFATKYVNIEHKQKWDVKRKRPTMYPVIAGYRNVPELKARLQKYSYRSTQAAIGIPKPVNTIIPVTFKPASRKQYNNWMQRYVEQFNSQLNSSSLKVVADIKLTLIMKARELTSGWVKDDQDNYLDISREKLDAALAIVENERSQGNPVCVWTGFNRDIFRLSRELKIPLTQTWSNLGSSKEHEQRAYRKELYADFQAGKVPILIGLDQLAKEALDFSQARAAIYFSVGPSSIVDTQLSGRLQAPDRYPEHFRLMVRDTVDEVQWESLGRKLDLSTGLWSSDILQKIIGTTDLAEVVPVEDDGWDEFIKG